LNQAKIKTNKKYEADKDNKNNESIMMLAEY